MPKVFVSYRRTDTELIIGRIRERLEKRFGRNTVFVDNEADMAGLDFPDEIKRQIGQSDVVLAVIGDLWTGPRPDGTARIFDDTDWVRTEIETALDCGTSILPILINQTPMPPANALPPSIQPFAHRNALRLSSGRDFDGHIQLLIRSIERLVARTGDRSRDGQASTRRGVPGRTSALARGAWLVARLAIVAACLPLLASDQPPRNYALAAGGSLPVDNLPPAPTPPAELESKDVSLASPTSQPPILTPERGSAERTELMDALRPAVSAEIGGEIQFEVFDLRVMPQQWAYANVRPQRPRGGAPIDWSKTKFRQAMAQGTMSDRVMALLFREGSSWRVAEYAIGPKDAAWERWRQERRLPRQLFPDK
jgi:hypothetical protein